MALMRAIAKHKRKIAVGAGSASALAGGAYIYKKRRGVEAKKPKISARPKKPISVAAHTLLGGIPGYYIGKHRHKKYEASMRAYRAAPKRRRARKSR